MIKLETRSYKLPLRELEESDFDEDGFLIESDDLANYFDEWDDHSYCVGSGYCNFQDTYIPVRYERIQPPSPLR